MCKRKWCMTPKILLGVSNLRIARTRRLPPFLSLYENNNDTFGLEFWVFSFSFSSFFHIAQFILVLSKIVFKKLNLFGIHLLRPGKLSRAEKVSVQIFQPNRTTGSAVNKSICLIYFLDRFDAIL